MPLRFTRRTLFATLLALGLSGQALASDNGKATGKAPSASNKNDDYYLTGNAADAVPAPSASPMWVLMGGAITDSHLVTRDRMGRLVTFLARMLKDQLAPLGQARGIGVDEGTAVVVDNGVARVEGASSAYFLLPTVAPATVASKKPLEMQSVRVERLSAGPARFNLGQWSASTLQLPAYWLGASGGSLSSSQLGGSPY
jgi:cyanophycinase-like exopeptidase